MKRTALKRKTPLSQGASLKRSPMKRSAPKRRPAKASNDERFRSPEYLDWVRTLPCVVCGATGGIAAHHLKGIWHMSGAGLKAPDSFSMPACDPSKGSFNDCHQQIHSERALRERQPKFLRHVISLGVRQFDGEIREALREAWAFIDERESA